MTVVPEVLNLMNLILPKKKSITIIHGFFPKTFWGELKAKNIFVLEGRPSLESSKIACRELLNQKVKPTVIADNMAGFLFFKQCVKEVWISAQSFDEEGVLSPVGSLILGVLAKHHNIPVRVYLSEDKKKNLVGKSKEVLDFNGIRVAPVGVKAYVPLVESVPQKYLEEVYE